MLSNVLCLCFRAFFACACACALVYLCCGLFVSLRFSCLEGEGWWEGSRFSEREGGMYVLELGGKKGRREGRIQEGGFRKEGMFGGMIQKI